MMRSRLMIMSGLVCCLMGCSVIEDQLFPVWERNDFDTPPTAPGPYTVDEWRLEVEEGADGQPFGITIFEPIDAEGALPVFVWVMGSNVQAYYHQSLHEILASWGYLVLVPDTRPLRFTDFEYHNRLVLLAEQTIDLAILGALGREVDEERIAAGGYSVGAPLAAFTAARMPQVNALVYWAPSGAPFWQGLNGNRLFGQVTQQAFYVLGELDDLDPEYPSVMRRAMPDSPYDEFVIEGATHHQFQQPTGADRFSDTPGITRYEQHGIAIQATLDWLDIQFGFGASI